MVVVACSKTLIESLGLRVWFRPSIEVQIFYRHQSGSSLSWEWTRDREWEWANILQKQKRSVLKKRWF